MFDGFMTELALTSLMIALPASFVLVYQWGEKNGSKKMIPRIIEYRNDLGKLYNIPEIRRARQKIMDDRIFNTVKEFRNGVD